jgi:hypothetical protein
MSEVIEKTGREKKEERREEEKIGTAKAVQIKKFKKSFFFQMD